eukprot:scaffold309333_cov33-Prasinocladus_malaysianus.AAC.1
MRCAEANRLFLKRWLNESHAIFKDLGEDQANSASRQAAGEVGCMAYGWHGSKAPRVVLCYVIKVPESCKRPLQQQVSSR